MQNARLQRGGQSLCKSRRLDGRDRGAASGQAWTTAGRVPCPFCRGWRVVCQVFLWHLVTGHAISCLEGSIAGDSGRSSIRTGQGLAWLPAFQMVYDCLQTRPTAPSYPVSWHILAHLAGLAFRDQAVANSFTLNAVRCGPWQAAVSPARSTLAHNVAMSRGGWRRAEDLLASMPGGRMWPLVQSLQRRCPDCQGRHQLQYRSRRDALAPGSDPSRSAAGGSVLCPLFTAQTVAQGSKLEPDEVGRPSTHRVHDLEVTRIALTNLAARAQQWHESLTLSAALLASTTWRAAVRLPRGLSSP